MKILRIAFENLPNFYNHRFAVDFAATDRVLKDDALFRVDRMIHTEKQIAFVGMNATGKTTVLRLLNMAAKIVINHVDLNNLGLMPNDIIQDGTTMQVVFFMDGNYYQMESLIGIRDKHGTMDASQEYYYKEEALRIKPKSSVTSKKNIFDFSNSVKNMGVRKRTELSEDTRRALKDDASMIILTTRNVQTVALDLLQTNYLNYSPMKGKTPNEILNVFDDNIEYLTTVQNKADNTTHWKLKFKNQDKVFDTDFVLDLNRVISAGTVKGHALLGQAIAALHFGGYLIVDELENHFNKELVHMILDIFSSPKTNPHGACLIFSTHYAEILDFMDRKDNIYITRKTDGLLSVSKFSNEVKRNDVKKSELIISNCLHGTAPQYENMQALREVICKIV